MNQKRDKKRIVTNRASVNPGVTNILPPVAGKVINRSTRNKMIKNSPINKGR